jgi:hypothetical protein
MDVSDNSSPSFSLSSAGSQYTPSRWVSLSTSGAATTGYFGGTALYIGQNVAGQAYACSLDQVNGLLVTGETVSYGQPLALTGLYSQVKSSEVKTPKLSLGYGDTYLGTLGVSDGRAILKIVGGEGTIITSNVTVGKTSTTSGSPSFSKYCSVTASAFTQSSDERLKTKISDITLTSEQISEAPAIVYHWNTDDAKTRRAGTTAQYWQNILPEVVVEDDLGNLSLNYSELSAVSVISLAKEVVALKAKIKELENK